MDNINDQDEKVLGATDETVGEGEEGVLGATGADEENEIIDEPVIEENVDTVEVETAQYVITGLVDTYDEQHNITGQYPIGSEQELPIEFGDAAVEDGRATRVE